MRQRQAESLGNKKMQRGSADVIDDRMSSFRNGGEMHTITQSHTKNTLLHCATRCRYELQKKCNCIVKKFESFLILQKSKMQPFVHFYLCWLWNSKNQLSFFIHLFSFSAMTMTTPMHERINGAMDAIKAKVQWQLSVWITSKELACCIYIPAVMGALSIHATVAPTQSFFKWTEKKERTGWWESERERERESIPLSFSQEEKRRR